MTVQSDPHPSPNQENAIKVSFTIDSSFPVHFCQDVFDPNNLILAETIANKPNLQDRKLFFVVDQGIIDNFPDISERIFRYCKMHQLGRPEKLLALPGGEKAKTFEQVERLYQHMLSSGLDRQSFVVAIGGGAVLDAVGYATTTFHRGIRLIRMPTTVLAQNDAGIGVKNGINAYRSKNLIGCFSPPYAVINDNRWLHTLSDRDFRSGFAEAVKVALIRDGEFYRWLSANTEKLMARDDDACGYLIKRCAELHLHQISCGGDPFEKGSSRPLDYGHWSAHKLESLSNYELSHGEAVAIGIVLDALYSHETGLLSQHEVDEIATLMQSLGFSLWHPALLMVSPRGDNSLLEGLEEFRQHLGGRLCITLLIKPGTDIEVDEINTQLMLDSINKLQLF